MDADLPQGAGNLNVGSRVGRYVLERQIGHGGMAAVFTARDDQLGRVVALKVLAPSLAADERFRQRFVRESRAAAAVDDPHIIPLFEAGEAGGVLFIAMRYVPGGDVRSLLFREGPLSLDKAASIIAPVASALDAAHAAGLVHRDVKPANMLLDTNPGRPDHVYLSDFGLTKDTVGSSGLTGTGLFLGTVDYAAPEQADGRPLDGRADQYSLACAAYEMLTGQPPFPRDQPLAVLAAHLSQQPPPISSRRPGLPASLDAVFARALAKSPDDRYPTCGNFSNALRAAIGLGHYDPVSPVDHPRTQQVWSAPPPANDAAELFQRQAAGADASRHDPRTEELAVTPNQQRFAGTPDQSPDPALTRGGSGRATGRLVAGIAVAVAAVVAGATIITAHVLAARHTTSRRVTKTVTPSPSATVYRDPSGFAVSLPAGWSVSSSSTDKVTFSGPQAGFVVLVEWSHHPLADALADWREHANAKAAADPTYQQIQVRRVEYRGYNAADWEFTNVYQGVLTHVIDRTFIVTPGQLAYAVELSGPDNSWSSVYPSVWPRLLSSFRPGH